MRRSHVTTASFALTLGCAASAAHACMGCTPDRYAMFPGMTFLRPDMILLLPILSGAIERPIYTFAGYGTGVRPTLAFSIQANLLAMLATLVAASVGAIALDSVDLPRQWYGVDYLMPFLMFVGLPTVGMLVKLAWFSRVPRDAAARPRVGWFILATLVSTTTIALIPFWMSLLGTDTYRYAERVAAIKGIAILAVLVGSIVTHVALFSRFHRPPRRDVEPRGFEVVPTV